MAHTGVWSKKILPLCCAGGEVKVVVTPPTPFDSDYASEDHDMQDYIHVDNWFGGEDVRRRGPCSPGISSTPGTGLGRR